LPGGCDAALLYALHLLYALLYALMYAGSTRAGVTLASIEGDTVEVSGAAHETLVRRAALPGGVP
jgi:hypothetical protein